MKYAGSGFLGRNVLSLSILACLCLYLMLEPGDWLPVCLVGASLLERNASKKVLLVVLVLLSCTLLSVRNAASRDAELCSDEEKVDPGTKAGHEVLNPQHTPAERDVLIFELAQEKEERFARLAHKLCREYGAILFECRLRDALFRLFLEQLPHFSCFRTTKHHKAHLGPEKESIILTYICPGRDKQPLCRISYKKEYAFLLHGVYLGTRGWVFKNTFFTQQDRFGEEHVLRFAKFYPRNKWVWLRRILTANKSPSKPPYLAEKLEEMDYHAKVHLYEILGLNLKGFLEFEYSFVPSGVL